MDLDCIGLSGIDGWTNDWNSGACSNLFHNLILVRNDGSPGYNPGNLEISQLGFSDAFDFLLSNQDGDIQDPPTNVQSDMLSACIFTPGLCDQALDSFCSTKTREEITESQQLLAFCGCHAPIDPLLEGIDPQCDPLCNQIGTIPLQNPMTGLALECNTTVCVINDVTLASGSISQLCSKCTDSQPCKCIISNVPQGLDISMCGSDSICLEPNNIGVLEPVPCDLTVTSETTFSINMTIAAIIILLVITIILFIFFYPIFKKKKKKNNVETKK
uniref:Transmembrane protein n=1 Tax=Pithovirus LCPAC401 TaxID=2506595 RepID=A0A481Z9N3_9VIRU|nr:MAG: transmembrane protein [Pithovirus LCPAC401]